MKRLQILLFFCAVVPLQLCAEALEMRDLHKHELTLGWGDMITETAFFHASPRRDYSILPQSYTATENRRYRHTGHLVLSYQYRVNSWFGAGGRCDASAFLWDTYTFTGGSMTPQKIEAQHCYNIAVMPEVWFTWYHHYWVDLYSSLGIGMVVNGGTETDENGKKTVPGAAVDATILGCSVGTNHVFGSLELGGMLGLKDVNHIFMLGARFITVSVGVRF